MKDVYKPRKRKPLGDKTGLLNVVPQCKEISVKLVLLDSNTKTMNTTNKKNAVNKVSEMNKNVKSTRRGRKVAVGTLDDKFKGKTNILKVVLGQHKKIEEDITTTTKTAVKLASQEPVNKLKTHQVPTVQKKLKVNKTTTSKDKTSQNIDTKPNLRRKPPKVYTEQDSTVNDTEAKQQTNKESAKVPIYKRQLQEEPKKATADLYEFTDVSPKQKKPTHPHRSSILFDKETYEIMQKIEKKEVKAKKKKLASGKKKPTYDAIMSNIVLNLKEKILKISNKKPEKENKENQEQTHNNSQVKNTVSNVKSQNLKSSETSLEHPQTSAALILEESPQLNNDSSTDDLHNSFGFVDEELPASTPMKPPSIRILSDIQLSKGININNESSIDFNVKKPNANSTMLNLNKSCSSPWRWNWVNIRHNPHFLSVKPNALPRIDQEPVFEHTLVESFESGCRQTPKKPCESTPKKNKVQQSILNYIDSNIEKENTILHGSLYDYEAFNSPVKSIKKSNKTSEEASNLFPDENAPTISSPLINANRRCLTDITNNTLIDNNVSYFGFDKSVEVKSPVKSQEALPMRFDVTQLKKYPKKNKKVKFPEPEPYDVKAVENESFLDIAGDENVDGCNQEVHLFEEPEEMLANMVSYLTLRITE